MDIAREFGAALRVARERRGISQNGLAAETGLTQQAISRYEHGARSPSLFVQHVLAQALGVAFEVSGQHVMVVWDVS